MPCRVFGAVFDTGMRGLVPLWVCELTFEGVEMEDQRLRGKSTVAWHHTGQRSGLEGAPRGGRGGGGACVSQRHLQHIKIQHHASMQYYSGQAGGGGGGGGAELHLRPEEEDEEERSRVI